MKKIMLIGICTILFSIIMNAQAIPSRASIVAGSATINPIYTLGTNSRDTFYQIILHVALSGTYDNATASNNTITFALDPNLSLSNNASIYQPEQVITSNKWASGNIEVHLLLKGTSVNSKLTADEIGHIIIKDHPETYYTIRLSDASETSLRDDYLSSEVPFWAEVGTNFDLVDKIQAQNIYGGIFMFEKDKFDISKNSKENKNVSFTGGVYETKSTSLTTSSDSGILYRDNRSFIETSQGFPYFRDTGSIATTSEVTSIGIFISPHIRLGNLPVSKDGVHFFVSFYGEMLWQRTHSSFDYSKTALDTIYYTTSTNLSRFPFKEGVIENDYRSHYFGLGLPIYIKDYDDKNRWRFSLYINPVIGMSTQRFIALQNFLDSTQTQYQSSGLQKNSDPLTNTFATPIHKWNPFYLFQFRLNEEKIGISFTGEVRGFFLNNSKPIISLSLSKKFDIASFYNSLTKSPTESATENAK